LVHAFTKEIHLFPTFLPPNHTWVFFATPHWWIFHHLKINKASFIVATLALGSRPRQKGLQGCGPKGNLGVTSETPGSEGECEGVSHDTPKATPTLGDGLPMDSRNFRKRFEGSNLNGSWRSLYHWKALEA
jgi:hypothetical protein